VEITGKIMAKAYDITHIRYKKLIPEAQTPFKKIDIDAGFDMYCTSIEETPDYIAYHTGIAFEIPVGMVGLAFPRSSVIKKDLMLKNCVGVIDASYRGELIFMFSKVVNEIFVNGEIRERVSMFSKSMRKFYKIIDIIFPERHLKLYEVGDRIGQVVFLDLPKITLEEALELSETERGSQGFGHTGK
jgi:dUTP pyrophosphatase